MSISLTLISVMVVLLGACSNEGSKADEDEKNSEIVATVNGEEILKTDVENQLKASKAYFQQQGMNLDQLDTNAQQEFKQSILDQLINTELLLQAAQNEGISVEQNEIDSEVDKTKSQYGDTKKYQEALKENQLTEKTLKKEIRDQLILTKFFDEKIGEITVSEDEIKSTYEQYKKQVESQGQELSDQDFEKVKPQMEEQVIAQKKNEKIGKIIENLRKTNKETIKIL